MHSSHKFMVRLEVQQVLVGCDYLTQGGIPIGKSVMTKTSFALLIGWKVLITQLCLLAINYVPYLLLNNLIDNQKMFQNYTNVLCFSF